MKPLEVYTKEQLMAVIQAKVPAVTMREIKCLVPAGTPIFPGFRWWLAWRVKRRLRY